LRLEGTLVLHSKTAERNGGDFDFDLVAVVPEAEFPLFVNSRFEMKEAYQRAKDKKKKIRSPWWNLTEVAMKARGNQIGRITNLISSCVAAGRHDYAYELVDQLQNSLDALKHNIQVDEEAIRRIRAEVPRAPWLDLKEARRISDLPLQIAASPSDVVADLYNHVRKEIAVLFEDLLPLRDFAGMITPQPFTQEMYDECVKVNQEYAVAIQSFLAETEKVKAKLAEAKAEYGRLVDIADPRERREVAKRFYRGKALMRANEERLRQEMSRLHQTLFAWGNGKRANRFGWCYALHSLAVSTQNPLAKGSIVFHCFPQEIVDLLVERTGGQPVRLQFPELPDGEVMFDDAGNVFRVEWANLPDGQVQERRTFLFRVSRHGDIYKDDVKVRVVQPFRIQSGSGEVRDGTMTFASIPQRPTVRHAQSLRSRAERARFVDRCERQFGVSFAVYVDGDPSSARVLDSEEKKLAFVEDAAIRPWTARPLSIQ
jgi:hypothetical protein